MKPLNSQHWSAIVEPGSRVFIGSGAACPHALIQDMLTQYYQLKDLELVHILTLGDAPWAHFDYERNIRVNAFFLSQDTREAVQLGRADYTPCFLSEVPALFTQGILPLDVALIMVSPPDEDGFCSMGVSVDVVSSACRSAKRIVAQINPHMPRTFGESLIHQDKIEAFIEHSEPLPEIDFSLSTDTTRQIGRYVAQLIDDGSTLQLGMGHIPDAICEALSSHKNLGMHTEMFGDGAMRLMKQGVINNSRRSVSNGKTTTSFCMGSRELYQFVDNNSDIEFLPSEKTNNIVKIALNENMVSINSALQIDLTGQVVADSIGERFYSGIGGQVDFIRGAALSRGGKAIIAMPSTAAGGSISRIVAQLDEAAGVVTSRGDVQYVVTEYGIATLHGRSIRERALELIQIAHPQFREALLDKTRTRQWVPNYQHDAPHAIHDIEGLESKKLTLGKGSYTMRTLNPSDQRNLQEFFYSHNHDTIHLRYGYEVTDMNKERAYRLVNVQQDHDLALGIFEMQGPRRVIHAVGRYYLEPTEEAAEFALVVREEKRRLGMAETLLVQLIHIAKKRQLNELWAFVLKENQPMLELVKKLGGQIQPIDNQGIVKASFTLKK